MMRASLLLSGWLLSLPAQAAWHWQANGMARDAQGRTYRSGLTAVSAGWETPAGLFLAGQLATDASGLVVRLTPGAGKTGDWALHAPPRQFFRYQGALYLHDMEGTVYHYTADGWPVANWRVPPASQLLQPDEDRELIVCTPAPMSKLESGRHHGGCQALQAGWQQTLDWWPDIPPRLCGDSLVVLGWKAAHRQLFRIRLSDGAVQEGAMLSRKAARPGLDLCSSALRGNTR